LHYSVAGSPSSWPHINVIEAFPLEEHDELIDCIGLTETLIIGASGAMIRLDSLPRSIQGVFDASRAIRISGAPGLACEYGMTKMSVQGESHAVWISHQGIYRTNGMLYDKISEGIDWEVIETFTKTAWVLHWDQKYEILTFAYSSTATGANDRYYLLHMATEHRKQNGQPKVTGPHFGEFYALASAQVGSQRKMYSAHTDDGKVYFEDNGTHEESNAFSDDGVRPVVMKTRKNYDDEESAVLGVTLRHTDFGEASSAVATVKLTSGRDFNNSEVEKTKTITLTGDGGTHMDFSQSGQWHEFEINYTGRNNGAFKDMRIEARNLSRSGTVEVA